MSRQLKPVLGEAPCSAGYQRCVTDVTVTGAGRI